MPRRHSPLLLHHSFFKEQIMVKNKLWCIGLALAFTLPSFAKKKVPLSGQWGKSFRSNLPQYPIQAWIEDNNKDLLLEFSSNLGSIEVIVTNFTGNVIHKQSIDTKATSFTTISLNKDVREDDIIYITDGNNIIYGNLFNN